VQEPWSWLCHSAFTDLVRPPPGVISPLDTFRVFASRSLRRPAGPLRAPRAFVLSGVGIEVIAPGAGAVTSGRCRKLAETLETGLERSCTRHP